MKLPLSRALSSSLRFAACTALLLAALATSAKAQVLVYRLDISNSQGINFHNFNGGYFAAPLLGGTGSFLLTSNEDGLTFSSSGNSGNMFTATNTSGKKSVISATTGGSGSSTSGTTSTSTGAFVAIGDIGHTLHVNTPTVSLSLTVAYTLSGMSVSADSEGNATQPAADGSLGSAGFSQIKFVLDETQTELANKQGLSLSQTVDQLKLVLERQGYSEETSTGSTGTGTGTTGTGSTGTGTTGTGTTGTGTTGTTTDTSGSTVNVNTGTGTGN